MADAKMRTAKYAKNVRVPNSLAPWGRGQG